MMLRSVVVGVGNRLGIIAHRAWIRGIQSMMIHAIITVVGSIVITVGIVIGLRRRRLLMVLLILLHAVVVVLRKRKAIIHCWWHSIFSLLLPDVVISSVFPPRWRSLVLDIVDVLHVVVVHYCLSVTSKL